MWNFRVFTSVIQCWLLCAWNIKDNLWCSHTQDGPEAANTTMADLEVWEDKLNKIFQLEALEKSATALLSKEAWENHCLPIVSKAQKHFGSKTACSIRSTFKTLPSKLSGGCRGDRSLRFGHAGQRQKVRSAQSVKGWINAWKRWSGAFWLHGLWFQQILEGLTGTCGQLVNTRGGERKIKYSVLNQSSAVQVFTHPTSFSRHVPRAWMRREGGKCFQTSKWAWVRLQPAFCKICKLAMSYQRTSSPLIDMVYMNFISMLSSADG